MEVEVIIEISAQSPIKYEMDEKLGRLRVDRFLYTAMFYPFNYGYILNTKGEDGDPLDALVLSEYPILPGAVLKAKPIGILEMEDEEGIDTKIILVPTEKIDPVWGKMEGIEEIPEMIKKRIKHFFERYKELEPGKWVKVKDFKGREEAVAIIERSYSEASGE